MATVLSSTPASGSRSLGRVAAASPLSPTRLSRLQEKEELQQLNDRLAAYIERVRALEADNSVLQQRLAERQAGSDRELGSLRLHYEAELADARRSLDEVAMQRATLQVELGKLSEEHRQLHSRSVPRPRAGQPWGWHLVGVWQGEGVCVGEGVSIVGCLGHGDGDWPQSCVASHLPGHIPV